MLYVHRISMQRYLLGVLISVISVPIKSMEMTRHSEQLKQELYAKKGQEQVIKLLRNLAADINGKDNDGTTALHWAVRTGHEQFIVRLINLGANINEKDNNGATALHAAAWTGHEQIIELLLNSRANVNAKDNNGTTALHLAAQKGHEQFIVKLVNLGANINEKDNNGATALHAAAWTGHEQIIELLLNLGANINETDMYGNTALHKVVNIDNEKKREQITEQLLNRGANIDAGDKNGTTTLHWAVQKSCSPHIIELLLKRGANINEKDCRGITALHLAVKISHQQVIELLLKRGAAIDEHNYDDGDTALHIASYPGNRNVVKLLLDSNATIHKKNHEGKTALHLAATRGGCDVIQALLANGATINEKNNEGRTALHFAAQKARTATVETLLACGAEVNAKDLAEQTALHHAAIYGDYKEVVEDLITQGANIHEKDITGKTALDWALEKGHKGIVQFLQSYPVSIFEKLMKILQKNEQLAYLPALEKHLQSKTFCNKINTVLSGRQCLLSHLEETKIAVNPNHSPLPVTAERSITHFVEKNYKEGPETDHSLENNHYDIRFKENYQETFNAGLALDGEGLQVMVTASMIEELEKEGYIIHKLFDIITGSSFGGILALGLTASKDGYERSIETKDIIKLFSDDFRDIFLVKNKIKIKPYYALKPLQKALANLFKQTVLSNALSRVIVPCQAKKPFDFDSLEAQKRASRDFYLRDTACITAIDRSQEYFPAMPLNNLSNITASNDYKNKSAEFLMRNVEETLNREDMQKFRLLYCFAHQDEGNMRIDAKLEKMNILTPQATQKSNYIKDQINGRKKNFHSLNQKEYAESKREIEKLEKERSELAVPRYCCIKPIQAVAPSFDNTSLLDIYKEQGKKAAEDFIKKNEQFLRLLKENSDRKQHSNFFAS